MSTPQTRGVPARLERLRRRFDRWRETQRVRSRLPDELWASAVKMAGVFGLNRTARALRLDYYVLKKRIERQAPAAASPLAKTVATFLELPLPADQGHPTPTNASRRCPVGACAMPAQACDCTIEWENVAGAKMRVHLKAAEPPDMVALSQSFWNPGP
jgi:hypothetical protein